MSLRRRLFLPVVTALLPIIAIEAYNQVELRSTREQEVNDKAVDQARRVAAEQERIVDGVRNVLSTLVVLNSVRSQQAARCNGLFAAILPKYEGFKSLVATRADGTPFCAARANDNVPVEALAVGERPFFKEAMGKEVFVVGGYARVSGSGTPIFHIALPYFDHGNRPRGVVYVGYSLKSLANRLSGSHLAKNQTLSLVDRDGVFLVRQPGWKDHVGRPISHEVWSRIAAATAPFHFEARSPQDGVARVFGVIPSAFNSGGFAVSIGLDRAAEFGSLNEANLREILVIAGGTLFAFFLAWQIGLRLVRAPIEGLLETTRRWRNGDLAARTGLVGPTEFGQLGEAFDAMADDLQQAMHAKDMLLQELNHRVMNSLQTISALFSLQARSLQDPDARAKFNDAVSRINSIAVAYRRMHTSGGVDTIDFAEFLRELCADISRSLLPEDNPCRVTCDPVLLGSQQASSLALIVNEMVTNAVKHGGKNSLIEVVFTQSADGYRLSVRNAGALPPDYDPAAGSGFGMRMVKMLVDQLGGEFTVSSGDGHTAFTVTFTPAAPAPTDVTVVEDQNGAADKVLA